MAPTLTVCRPKRGGRTNPTRQIGRSAGSNQSAAGGNKCGEVLCVTVTSGDLATMQAETRVNAEQASKTDVAEADPSEFRGRPLPLGRIATAPNGSVGVMASACMEEEIDRNTGSPSGERSCLSTGTP